MRTNRRQHLSYWSFFNQQNQSRNRHWQEEEQPQGRTPSTVAMWLVAPVVVPVLMAAAVLFVALAAVAVAFKGMTAVVSIFNAICKMIGDLIKPPANGRGPSVQQRIKDAAKSFTA